MAVGGIDIESKVKCFTEIWLLESYFEEVSSVVAMRRSASACVLVINYLIFFTSCGQDFPSAP